MSTLHSLFRSSLRALTVCFFAVGPAMAADAALSRTQALKALTQIAPAQRLAAVQRLADVGAMQDTPALVLRLNDDAQPVRDEATAALWKIWSRSGDPKIDALLARGVAQMEQQDIAAALQTFTDIVQRKPDFAEGWNKRATVLFLMGENEKSLSDCDQVLRRNPQHFGALSGAGQIHLQLDQPKKALEFLQRALDVNPNLSGLARSLPMLEQRVRDKLRNST